ncbi:hypothetical protein EIP86_010883 [Pleurotus ostreatoroseus]|nr:hypothetical protein EIP86_010883 [Pleurotus ostreatoroseus]
MAVLVSIQGRLVGRTLGTKALVLGRLHSAKDLRAKYSVETDRKDAFELVIIEEDLSEITATATPSIAPVDQSPGKGEREAYIVPSNIFEHFLPSTNNSQASPFSLFDVKFNDDLVGLQAAWEWSQPEFQSLPFVSPTGYYYQHDAHQLWWSQTAHISASTLGTNSANLDYYELDRHLDDQTLVVQLKNASIYKVEQLKEFAKWSQEEKRNFLITTLNITQFCAEMIVWKITDVLKV